MASPRSCRDCSISRRATDRISWRVFPGALRADPHPRRTGASLRKRYRLCGREPPVNTTSRLDVRHNRGLLQVHKHTQVDCTCEVPSESIKVFLCDSSPHSIAPIRVRVDLHWRPAGQLAGSCWNYPRRWTLPRPQPHELGLPPSCTTRLSPRISCPFWAP